MEYIRTKWLSHPLAYPILGLALPLIVGILLSLLIPRPIIGTIYIRDAIYAESVGSWIPQIRYAYDHPEISAVVLVVSSPGGTVADTESLYFEVMRLRQRKPVVVSVETMAASGAYYTAVAADYIMARPTSEVGNIGVRTVLPSAPAVFEDEVSTGPYKFTGGSRDETLRLLDPIKVAFYQAVVQGRGKALTASAETVLSGKLWLGMEALQLGLVDGLGSLSDALDKAASLAHVWNYETKELGLLVLKIQLEEFDFFLEGEDGSITPYPRKAGMYYLYIPESDRRLP